MGDRGIAIGGKVSSESVIGQAGGLLKAWHSLVYFDIYPTVDLEGGEIILLDDLCRNYFQGGVSCILGLAEKNRRKIFYICCRKDRSRG